MFMTFLLLITLRKKGASRGCLGRGKRSVGFRKRGLVEKGSFRKNPFCRDSREFRDSRDCREPPNCGK